MTDFKSPTGDLIVAILETTPCRVGITSISADGREVEYDGTGSQMFWDDQKPVKRNDSYVFLDENGGEWTFDQLIKVEEEEELQTLTVTGAERDTILAALRYWQERLTITDPHAIEDESDLLVEIATNAGTHPALDAEAIDELCERINV
jgi:hypothetical protein